MKKYLWDNHYISIWNKFVKIYSEYHMYWRTSKYDKGTYNLSSFSEEQLSLAKKSKDWNEMIKILDL